MSANSALPTGACNQMVREMLPMTTLVMNDGEIAMMSTSAASLLLRVLGVLTSTLVKYQNNGDFVYCWDMRTAPPPHCTRSTRSCRVYMVLNAARTYSVFWSKKKKWCVDLVGTATYLRSTMIFHFP